MTATLAEIWRHPIKAHGREQVAGAMMTAGACLPWDRVWAIAHDRSKATNEEWASCVNFTRAASAPGLMAISCTLDETREELTLRHPDRPDITLNPDRDQAALIDWVTPLMPAGRAVPVRVVRVPGRGMTDSGTPGVTIANTSSHRAVEQKLGRPLSGHRWRSNLWVDGLAPWEEFDWIDRHIRIGGAIFHVYGRTERCRATEANPETGRRDADTLGTLKTWGHQDFSVKAEVVEGGAIAQGDKVEVI